MFNTKKSRNFVILISFSIISLTFGAFVTPDICGPNEEYQLCGTSCPFNCSSPEGPVECSDDCAEGCFCKSGYLKHENGSCVTPDQCFSENQTICEDNEEFLSCGSVCPLTCSQPEEPVVCGVACSMGCFCKSGFVRDESTNTCVTVDQCPTQQCFNQNEVFDTCNAACDPTCADPLPICTKICTSGCVCAPGYLRDEQGSCITVNNCPVGNATDPGLLGRYLDAINKILHLSSTA